MESRQRVTEPQLPPPRRGDGADDFFREVNARILELGDRFGFREGALELICECEDAACTARISIFAAEFAELRHTDGLHLIAEGHGHLGRVVRRGAGYVVVAD